MNLRDLIRFENLGIKKPELKKPQITTIPLAWLFAGMSVVFFLLDMKFGGSIFAWLAALSIIGFGLFWALDKQK